MILSAYLFPIRDATFTGNTRAHLQQRHSDIAIIYPGEAISLRYLATVMPNKEIAIKILAGVKVSIISVAIIYFQPVHSIVVLLITRNAANDKIRLNYRSGATTTYTNCNDWEGRIRVSVSVGWPSAKAI